MKKHLSTFALAARGSFWRVLAVTLSAALLCAVLLWLAPGQSREVVGHDAAGEPILQTGGFLSASVMVKKSFCRLPVMAGFALVLWLLSRTGTGRGTQPGYTALRLRIAPWRIAVLWTVYDLVMLLFYRAAVTAAVYGVIGRRLEDTGPQALWLSSYTNAFLHNLLPLRDPLGWSAMVAVTLLGAVSCALFPLRRWRGGSGTPVITAIVFTEAALFIPVGSALCVALTVIAGILLGYGIVGLFSGEEEETHETI